MVAVCTSSPLFTQNEVADTAVESQKDAVVAAAPTEMATNTDTNPGELRLLTRDKVR